MGLIRIMTVFGTRPEAIKLAPVIQQLEKDPRFKSIVVVTAQHREMLDQVLDLFNINPNRDLDLMRDNQDLASLTASIFIHLDPVLEEFKPDWLLVQGDTTTAMATTLAAYYRRIKVTGNTIIDAVTQITAFPVPKEIEDILEKKGILSGKKQLIVVTAHRRENFGIPIKNICSALQSLADRYRERIEIIYPVHLNPNVNEPVREMLKNIPNITLLPPLEYLSLVHLLKHAYLILTDSGGIQEEATGLGIPCLVLRKITERPEGVDAGVLKLVGIDTDTILDEAAHLLDDQSAYQAMAHIANPYGDGNAAIKIVKRLLNS